jgi:hypothetical protein
MPREYSPRQYSSRESRAQERFGTGYAPYSAPPVVHTYNDGFNPWFWMWLMQSNNQRERDQWVYHHREQMDPARYEELKRHDAELEKRLAALEGSGTKKDPTYVPKSFEKDADLMYKDEVAAKQAKETSRVSTYLWLTLLLLLVAAGSYYLFWPRYTRRVK